MNPDASQLAQAQVNRPLTVSTMFAFVAGSLRSSRPSPSYSTRSRWRWSWPQLVGNVGAEAEGVAVARARCLAPWAGKLGAHVG